MRMLRTSVRGEGLTPAVQRQQPSTELISQGQHGGSEMEQAEQVEKSAAL